MEVLIGFRDIPQCPEKPLLATSGVDVKWGCLSPQAPDRFNPKVRVQTCGIIQKLYETKQIETMTFGKSVIALFSKIEPKTSK